MEFNLTLTYAAGLDTCTCFSNEFIKVWNHLSSLQAQSMLHLNSRTETNNDSLVNVNKGTKLDHLYFYLCVKYWKLLELILKKKSCRAIWQLLELTIKWDFYHSMTNFSLYFRFFKTVWISCIM